MDSYLDRIGIEFISALGLPPIEFVHLAADLGCRHIGIALEPIVTYTQKYPKWSLRENSLRRQTVSAMHNRGVSVSLGEGFIVWPHKDIRDAGPDLDAMCELGVRRVNILSVDPDNRRTIEQLDLFAELAAARGLDATLEFLPGLPIGDLKSAIRTAQEVDKPNFRLLIDAMHLFRSGSSVADFAALDPDIIGYMQLCDVPVVSKYSDYATEARFDRLAPGAGELPLLELIAAAPANMIMGLEVPMLAKAQAGIGPHQRLSSCIGATQDLLRRAEHMKPVAAPIDFLTDTSMLTEIKK